MDETSLWSTREAAIFEDGTFHPEQRTVVREQIWRVFVNDRETGCFSCSPVQMQDAAIGTLFLSGMLSTADEVEHLEVRQDTGEILARIPHRNPVFAPSPLPFSLSASQVFDLISRLENQRQRGVHSCAIVQGETVLFRQDVSRGAAVDKAVGACLRQGISTENSILIFSGRVPDSIVEKCRTIGCRIILACSGPTDLACELAQQAGITIAALAGPGRFCVYTCPERIV